MRFLRRLGLLAAVAAGSAVLAGPAFGARPGGFPFTLDSTHFAVHYQSDTATNYAVTQTTAGDIAALAERAYSAELADGFAAPVSDAGLGGDNRIDIYVDDLTPFGNPLGVTIPDNAPPAASSSYIELDGTQPEVAFAQHTIAHELFHVIQLGTWNGQFQSDAWFFEGSAEWMGYRVTGYDTSWGLQLGPTDMALDCGDPLGTWQCDFDRYANNGYSRWSFFEYMWERYGASFFNDVLANGAGGASAINAISTALAARGTTLAATYNAWTQADLAGRYSVQALQGLAPVTVAKVTTGAKAGTVGTLKIPVNHLSTRIVEVDRGDGDASNTCYAATLTISIAMPAGTTVSQPVFWWNAKGSLPVPLTVSGNTASASLPWDTCTYNSTKGFLALPNASTNVDAADYVTTFSMTVDTSTPATPFATPDPVFMPTPTVPVSSADIAPTLSLFGPEVLKLTSGETQLRLIVESTGQGSVTAAIGATTLGKASLRGGNNDLRFTLPASLLTRLRRAAAAGNVLTLTPSSPSGATGQPVTRTVQIAPATAKTKVKAKVKRRAVKRRK